MSTSTPDAILAVAATDADLALIPVSTATADALLAKAGIRHVDDKWMLPDDYPSSYRFVWQKDEAVGIALRIIASTTR